MNASSAKRVRFLALLAMGSACDSRSLQVRFDAAIRDGSSSVDLAPTSQVPAGGQCADGYAPCGQGDGLRCYDLGRSQDNCGACGNVCASGIDCQAGACQQRGCRGALSFKTLVLGSAGRFDALGDFDGDGILDLVGIEDPDSPLSVFYGAGDGTFLAGPVIEGIRYWSPPDSGLPLMRLDHRRQSVVADLNGDGRMDLTSILEGDFAVSVRLGTGSREAPFAEATRYPIEGVPAVVMVADFDADARLDLMVSSGGALDYWRGQGDGGFVYQATLGSVDSLRYGPGIAVATDWNNDGVLDLVYGAGGYLGVSPGPQLGAGSRLSYRLGRGDGSFEAEIPCGLAMGIVGDLDHDGRPDLISSSSILGASLLLGISGCTASKVVPITDWTKQGGVAMADFNGDGNTDVVVDDNLAIMVHVGDGKGGFPHELTIPVPTDGQWPIGAFFPGDLDRDGKLDVVFARDGGWGVLLNTCP